MTIPSVLIQNAVVTPDAFATPSTTELVSPRPAVETRLLGRPNPILWVKIGATTTTVTVVRPGSQAGGDSITDYTTGPIANTERIIPLGPDFTENGTMSATIKFSQTTGVTALVLYVVLPGVW